MNHNALHKTAGVSCQKNQGWHIRHNIIVEADPRIIDHIISVLDYVLLEY